MLTRTGRACAALGALAAALLGCGQKDAGTGPRPVDAFGVADADVVVMADPAGLVGSAFYADLTGELRKLPRSGDEDAASLDEAVKETLGLELGRLRTVAASVNTADGRFVIAAEAEAAVDPDAVTAAVSKGGPKIEKRGEHAGVDLYASSDDDAEVMAFPAPTLVVLGTREEIRNGIDRAKSGEAVLYRGRMADLVRGAPKGAGVFVASVPSPELAARAGGAAGAAGLGAAAAKVEDVTLAARAGETLEVTLSAGFATEKDAADARAEIERGLAETREKLGKALGEAGMEPLRALLDGVEVGGSGRTAEVRLSARGDVAKTIPRLMAHFVEEGADDAAAPEAPAAPEPETEDVPLQQ